MHEDRVANLEARLAELSDTVGAYDRLRQNDLSNIQKLKDEIENLCKSQNTNCKDQVDFNDSEDFTSSGVHTILAKILKLKKILLIENDRLEKPIDLSNVFSHAIDHSKCKDEYNKLMQEYYEYKTKTQSARSANVSLEVSELKSHIKSLQDEIIILNGQIDKNEVIYKASLEEKTQNLIAQKNHYKQLIYDIENDFKEHVSQLEKQLQKQRDRSIGLLEEKEHEIKTLKESFEIFLPGNSKLYLDKCKPKTEQVDSHNLHQLNNVLQGLNEYILSHL